MTEFMYEKIKLAFRLLFMIIICKKYQINMIVKF